MRKFISVAACAVVAVASFAPVAQAKHRKHVPVAVAPAPNPVVDEKGQFYATPVNAGPADGAAILGVPVPGLGLATGAVNGALAVPGQALAVPGIVLPPLPILTP